MILHAVASGGLYGIERMLCSLLPALQRQGVRVGLVSLADPDGPGGEVARAMRALAVHTFDLPTAPGLSPGDLFGAWRLLGAQRPSAIHAHGYTATTLLGVVAPLRGVRMLATVHSEAAHAPEIARHLAIEALVLRRLSRVVVVSEGVARDAASRGLSPARLVRIANGIPDPGETAAPDAARVQRLAVVGRLVEGKNIRVLLDALAQLAPRHPALTLDVVGDGPDRAALEAHAARLGISGRISFAGFVDPVGPRLAATGTFVMPSRSEGMPMALLVAMAASRVIVASRVGGIPGVVHEGTEALLLSPGDSGGLAAAIERVLVEPGLASALGRAARARFERDFTATAMADAYAALYRREGIATG